MAIVFALPHLFDAVAARFTDEGTNVPMAFGWLAPNEQMRTTSRIVWSPGDASGNLGALGAGKYPGGNPRQLATLEELCTVEITAADTPSTDERKQYQAVRELYDAWLRAVYLAAHGTYRIVSGAWVGGDRARRMGATLRVVIAVQAPVFDEALETEAVEIEAATIDVEQLDVTETVHVPDA